MNRTLIVAGATGVLGRAVVGAAYHRGWRVRALGRNPLRLAALPAHEHKVVDFEDDSAVRNAIEPGDIVFSSLGASVSPWPFDGYASFGKLDVPLNQRLLRGAMEAGAGRVVYTSVAGADKMPGFAYVDAHEAVATAIKQSPLPFTIVRPTGFFSAFRELRKLGATGLFLLFGNPDARTNPIHHNDLALRVLDAIEAEESEIEVGGPEIFTRTEIADMAMASIERTPRKLVVSDDCVKLGAWFARSFSPRLSDIARFYLEVNSRDVVAPSFGTRHLADYFANPGT